MILPDRISQTSSEIMEKGAESVFLYGSRARGDYESNSDWEIGAIFADDRYVPRNELVELQSEGIVIYPFKKEELEAGIVNVPFTPSIWLTEIILTSHTIAGHDLMPSLPMPDIKPIDLLSDAVFYKARAIDAMIAQREGYDALARNIYVKSVLLGTRALILSAGRKFPVNIGEIVNNSNDLIVDELKHVPASAASVRNYEADLTSTHMFENIDLQCSIETAIKDKFGL